jgi:predicted transcriptional regulator
MPSHILELVGPESVPAFKALASETRVRILSLLAGSDMNINEIGQALGVSQPNVSKHVQILEEAGLIASDYSAGLQGMQKRCKRTFDRLIVNFEGSTVVEDNIAEIEMPIGLYSVAQPKSTCGLASREGFIGLIDEPVAFHFPERSQAQILWMADGYVEYVFANTLPPAVEVTSLELVMEVCSEAPGYNNEWPSDITVWINGLEIGTWTSPGDMGGRRGRLNPAWWNDNYNQYGFLKVWSVDSTGSYIDGMHVSSVGIKELNVKPWESTVVRIGLKQDAKNPGGLTLLGKGFGNYEQDLVLRLHHTSKRARGAVPADATSLGFAGTEEPEGPDE